MITKCVNQKCGQPFLFLRPGAKLFIMNLPSNPQPGGPGTTDQGPRKLEHFWLCENCAASMTLVVGQGSTPRMTVTTCEDHPSTGKRRPHQPQGAELDQVPLR